MINGDKKAIQRVVVGGVIIRDGKVLILQRHRDEDIYPNMWELPSGKKKALEPSRDALIREIREETSLEVKVIMPFFVFDYIIEKPDEVRDSTQINFIVVADNNDEIILSNEHQAFAWVSLDDVSKYSITDSTRETIKKAFEITDKLYI